MGSICAFIVGIAIGWFSHRYREKITRLKEKVSKAVSEELND